MGKRSSFARNPRDLYPTPPRGPVPLIPHVPEGATFCEPCAGPKKLLIQHLAFHGLACAAALDIDPEGAEAVEKKDAFKLTREDLRGADLIITNPPWKRAILHRLIMRFKDLAPTWLLLDADFAFNVKSAPYMQYCRKVVAVGRLKWIPGSKSAGKENCAWYLFISEKTKTEFIARNYAGKRCTETLELFDCG